MLLKTALEYILKNGSTQSIAGISEHVGYSLKRVRAILKKNNVQRYRLYTAHTAETAAAIKLSLNARTKASLVANLTPWPKPDTNMKTALRGRTYGGDTKAPGTKNPIKCDAVYTFNVCTYKSSMG